ncbi:MAG: hypothetical protein C7B46_08330 [Sulfobacillus benefaciens]|uniref:Uncharacterized protein n=1 Tax=Sulfobacillus benefaciens TaxID=453960 RepID=A0A2T2XH67_9FIRM|nr:MAG: hypothetical protein C7B46_08330 [Sulfobacillus benefaciens]
MKGGVADLTGLLGLTRLFLPDQAVKVGVSLTNKKTLKTPILPKSRYEGRAVPGLSESAMRSLFP